MDLNFKDTPESYGPCASGELIAKALAPQPRISLRAQGKIRLIVPSNVTGKHIERALEIGPVTSAQNRYDPVLNVFMGLDTPSFIPVAPTDSTV